MATQKELLYKVLEQTESNTRKIDQDAKSIGSLLNDVKQNQYKINTKLNDINKRILDPETGLIVSTNKNTDWRKRLSNEFKRYQKERESQARMLDEFARWKNVVDKVIWIIFTAVSAIVVKMIVLP